MIFVGSLLLGTKGADKAAKAAGVAGKGAEVAETSGKVGRLGELGGTTGTAGRLGEAGETAGMAGKISGGAAAATKGAAREQYVAELVGGRVAAGEKVIAKGIGSTDIDVIGAAGEVIHVGGPAKAGDLSHLGSKLKVLKAIADERGVKAIAYFEEGTPETALKLARKWLGDENVKIFPPP